MTRGWTRCSAMATPQSAAAQPGLGSPAQAAALRGAARAAGPRARRRHARLAALGAVGARRCRPADRSRQLAAQHRPDALGARQLLAPAAASSTAPPGQSREAGSKSLLDPGARRGQRPAMETRLPDRLPARRSLPGRHRRQPAALWRARRIYQPRLARGHRGRSGSAGRPTRRGMFERYGRAARSSADPGQGLLLGGARRRRRRPGGAGDSLARAGGRQPRPVLRPARARAARPDARRRRLRPRRPTPRSAPPSPPGRSSRRSAISA